VTLSGAKAHIMRNNLAFPNKNEYVPGYGVDTQFNSWDLNLTPAAKDFLSITDSSVGGTGQAIETTSLALGPRQADGSLPNVDFMKLAAGSAMIDKGTDVGLPFVGAAPDLGAYEYGAGGVPGGGGTTGAGGRTGSGGSTSTTGNGGTPGTGGRPTVGGTTGVGGSSGNGGTLAVGGTPGGTTVTGGRTASSGTGGATASAGTVGTGGSIVATGGNVASGGAIETGGFSASGGVASTSPVPSGGSPAAGGSPGTGALGGTTSEMGPAQESAGGCSCRIAEAQGKSYPGFALLALLMCALRLRKKH
jgi:MYXO-CTERM domain-containing protein